MREARQAGGGGTARRPRPLAAWIREHDESRLFTVLYIGLSVVLSVWISLFWLVAVVAGHGVLEWLALRYREVGRGRLGLVLWHIKLDLSLVVFALVLGLYMDTIFGMVGLGAMGRGVAQAGGRLVGWKQALRGLLLTVDDAAQVARAVIASRRRDRSDDDDDGADGDNDNDDNDDAEEEVEVAILRGSPWRQRWSRGDRFAVIFGGLCFLLLLLTPTLTAHTPETALGSLARELHPWPNDDGDA